MHVAATPQYVGYYTTMQKLSGELNTKGTAYGRAEPDIARAKGVQSIGTTTVTCNADRV